MTLHQFTSAISRAEVHGDTLRGYAAVFEQPTLRQRDFAGSESIARGAFDGLLDSDVVALVNHDHGQLLGRTHSGTLRLSSDEHGLAFELDLPETQLGKDIRTLVSRGDLRGMSFSAQLGDVERVQGGVLHRTFKRLVDVSVVTSPAYEGTSVALRSEDFTTREHSLRGQLIGLRARVLRGGN